MKSFLLGFFVAVRFLKIQQPISKVFQLGFLAAGRGSGPRMRNVPRRNPAVPAPRAWGPRESEVRELFALKFGISHYNYSDYAQL